MTAYDLVHEVRRSHPRFGVPTAYRLLARLTMAGAIYRIASLNAWIVKNTVPRDAVPLLGICESCGVIDMWTAPDLVDGARRTASARGFRTTLPVVELYGTYAACACMS